MGISRINLLQLGDVHFPDAVQASQTGDVKDHAFPTDMLRALSPSPLHSVVKHVADVVDDGRCHALVMMGDLTTQGRKVGYRDCFNYLAKAIWVRERARLSPDRILVTAGNHDVNREDAKSPESHSKFEYMNLVLQEYGLSEILVDTCQITSVCEHNAKLRLVGLNTSIGCGTMRGLPERIKGKVESVYDQAFKSWEGAEGDVVPVLWNELYEVLDTPMATANAIHDLQRKLDASDGVSVVFGHHNLFPQTTTRIAPYTEFLNSGNLRQSLLRKNDFVFYLHGHIHDDPIEILTSPAHSRASLIVVAAPEITKGYNLLKFEFDSDGRPLGCTVEQYRLRDGSFEMSIGAEIPLFHGLAEAQSDIEAKIMDLLKRRPSYYASEISRNLRCTDNDKLSEAVHSLKWKRMLRIEMGGKDFVSWTIRRAN